MKTSIKTMWLASWLVMAAQPSIVFSAAAPSDIPNPLWEVTRGSVDPSPLLHETADTRRPTGIMGSARQKLTELKDAYIRARDEHDLYKEACIGNLETVHNLLAKGVSPNTNIRWVIEYSRTPLIGAAKNGHIAIVNELLNYGAHIDDHDANGDTALILAARWFHLNIVKVLLSRGADRNKKNSLGWTPLCCAVYHSWFELAATLLQPITTIDDKAEELRKAEEIAAIAWAEKNDTYDFGGLSDMLTSWVTKLSTAAPDALSSPTTAL